MASNDEIGNLAIEWILFCSACTFIGFALFDGRRFLQGDAVLGPQKAIDI